MRLALDFLELCGIYGLFIATAIEASSLPFPGALFVLVYGYLMHYEGWQLVLLGAANGIVYTVFTLIPYGIGYRLEKFSKKKFDADKIEKAQRWFRKYGEWSIALSRPLSIGNYISYMSGISKIKPWRFLLFTFLGTFPWNTLLLFLGHSGSLSSIQHVLDFMTKFGYVIMSLVVVGLAVWYFIYRNKQKQRSEKG
ncbi:membrane protein DedA, SNARE-associated domain [Seinonella peptonophila]|uniref:Membrane protein DedA, SNARE-associated domain n=1 Tax=Seinonella peptonophila TaxID=112248 RepID=A0A1M4W859_9BACL|nr:VTT domain-containing protein [Seinonella peptonophila]SHE77283.1 membrane protein DedA, SNARE-associated domain [Seinonella peptonophila]